MRLQHASRARGIPAAARFRAWAGAAGGGRLDVTIRLVAPREGRQLNFAYRGKDHATNVLAFAYRNASDPREPATPRRRRAGVCGDIVLCPAVVAREAREQGKALQAHYAHLTVHAVLHLRGYEHDAKADAARMERAEIRILKRLGLANPYLA